MHWEIANNRRGGAPTAAVRGGRVRKTTVTIFHSALAVSAARAGMLDGTKVAWRDPLEAHTTMPGRQLHTVTYPDDSYTYTQHTHLLFFAEATGFIWEQQ